MSTATPLPAPAHPGPNPGLHSASPRAGAAEGPPEQALVPVAAEPGDDSLVAAASPLARMPVELDVVVPVRDFRVRNLLALVPGEVIETAWEHGDDLPLASGKVQLAWTEFEVLDTALAVRITRLA